VIAPSTHRTQIIEAFSVNNKTDKVTPSTLHWGTPSFDNKPSDRVPQEARGPYTVDRTVKLSDFTTYLPCAHSHRIDNRTSPSEPKEYSI
jgi:hypothetical protein